MGVTISTHNGSTVAREHNIRNERVVSKEAHIEPDGVFEVWHDEKVRDAYHRLFDASVAAYNATQEREERRIKNYFKTVCDDAKKHTAYEMIVAIGNSNGEMVDDVVGKEIMRKFVDGWQERNPNLALIGAYYHADEQGVPHVHVDYVPVAHGYCRGPSTQTGLVRALGEQGFEKQGKETAQIQWERRENAHLEQLCREHGIDVEHPLVENAQHLETELYKTQKALEVAIDHVNDLEGHIQAQELEITRLQTVVRSLKGEEKEQKDLQKEIAGRTLLGKPRENVTIPYKEYRTLQRISRETKDLKREQEELAMQMARLNTKKAQADKLLEEARADREEAKAVLNDLKGQVRWQAEMIAHNEINALMRGRGGSREARMEQYLGSIGQLANFEKSEWLLEKTLHKSAEKIVVKDDPIIR